MNGFPSNVVARLVGLKPDLRGMPRHSGET